MKRLFVLSLVAALSVGLLSVGAFAQQTTTGTDSEEATTRVYWEYTGVVSCEVGLDVHEWVNLGLAETNDAVLESGGNWVETNGNCSYSVAVEQDGYSAPLDTSANIFKDFGIKINNVNGDSVGTGTGGYINSDLNGSYGGLSNSIGYNHGPAQDSWTLAEVSTDGGTEKNVNFDMGYQYKFDEEDQDGDYYVELLYTVSTLD